MNDATIYDEPSADEYEWWWQTIGQFEDAEMRFDEANAELQIIGKESDHD